MAAATLEIVVQQLMDVDVLNFDKSGAPAALADSETLGVARTLRDCVLQRLVCDRVMSEVQRRNLLPVTIYTLSTLLCEALALYKAK